MEKTPLENLIAEVVKKVRLLAKLNYSDTIERSPTINVDYDEKTGKLTLRNISFDWYDSIIVTNNKIVYKGEKCVGKTLIEYKSFEDLLKM